MLHLLNFETRDLLPIFGMAIPIVAIVGGITAGILRTMGRQRLIELAQRERIAAIERGLDPSKLPPLPSEFTDSGGEWRRSSPKARAQSMMVGGIVTLFIGIGLSVFLSFMEDEGRAWAVGLLPGAIGLALLLSAFLIWPRDEK